MNLPYLFEGLYPHPALLCDLPLTEQATWVDVVCVEMCKTGEITKQVLGTATKPHDFDNWNATSVGNAAFIVLQAKNDQVQAVCRDKLSALKAWVAATFREPHQSTFPKQWELYQAWLKCDKKTPDFMFDNAEMVRRAIDLTSGRLPFTANVVSPTGGVINVPLCFWHDERPAVNKCSACKRFVCVECMRSVGDVVGVLSTTNHRTFCPLCGEERHKSNKKFQQVLCCIVVLCIIGSIIALIVKFSK